MKSLKMNIQTMNPIGKYLINSLIINKIHLLKYY